MEHRPIFDQNASVIKSWLETLYTNKLTCKSFIEQIYIHADKEDVLCIFCVCQRFQLQSDFRARILYRRVAKMVKGKLGVTKENSLISKGTGYHIIFLWFLRFPCSCQTVTCTYYYYYFLSHSISKIGLSTFHFQYDMSANICLKFLICFSTWDEC